MSTKREWSVTGYVTVDLAATIKHTSPRTAVEAFREALKAAEWTFDDLELGTKGQVDDSSFVAFRVVEVLDDKGEIVRDERYD